MKDELMIIAHHLASRLCAALAMGGPAGETEEERRARKRAKKEAKAAALAAKAAAAGQSKPAKGNKAGKKKDKKERRRSQGEGGEGGDGEAMDVDTTIEGGAFARSLAAGQRDEGQEGGAAAGGVAGEQQPEDNEPDKDKEKELTFKEMYMDMFTEEFADDLDQLRQNEAAKDPEGKGGLRVDALVDAIEAGMDVFTDLEKALYVEYLQPGRPKGPPIQKHHLDIKGSVAATESRERVHRAVLEAEKKRAEERTQ